MKAAALKIASQATRDGSWTDEHDYAKGDQELWTVKLVKEALVDAFRLLRHTAGKVGPGGLKAYWPEYFEAGDYPPEQTKTSPHRTRMSIARMEMVLFGWTDADGRKQAAWLRGPLEAMPDLREKLDAWIKAELNGTADSDVCERRKWALATFKRHRDRAAMMIAHRLNRLGVEIW